ncbi:DUF2834 domain-containing protein [Vibrio profundi]|uniref:DUF2834 domain-containing protein n=1 Tax=Vibrio profundi TaxID=1774960 RepID=UPI0037367C4B
MAKFYLFMTFLGIFIPYGALIPWLIEHGLDLSALARDVTVNPISLFAWLDVFVAALVLIAFIVSDARKTATPYWWLAIVGTLGVGVSCGLPLYLYLKTRHQSGSVST